MRCDNAKGRKLQTHAQQEQTIYNENDLGRSIGKNTFSLPETCFLWDISGCTQYTCFVRF